VAVGASKAMPLSGGGEKYRVAIERPGQPLDAIQPADGAVIVTTGYFAALGIPIVKGRDFTEHDMETQAAVLLVNQALARQLWPGEDPIGKKLMFGPKTGLEVIGLTADVRHAGLRASPGGAMYVPFARFPRGSLKFFLRTSGNPLAVAGAARAAIRTLEPDQGISDIQPLAESVSETVSGDRFFAILLVVFAALALLLAGSGLYAVTSYGIAQRTRIGVPWRWRGADVLRLVVGGAGLRRSAWPSGCGLRSGQ
jgi:hypothetical protein